MRPAVPLLNRRFKWRPYGDVQAVWRAHGWAPVTQAEREARQKGIRLLTVKYATLPGAGGE